LGRGLNTAPPRQLTISSVRSNGVLTPVAAIESYSMLNESQRAPPDSSQRSPSLTVSNA
jgi:hypothetical protein